MHVKGTSSVAALTCVTGIRPRYVGFINGYI